MILGLDLSSKSSGYCVLDDNGSIVESGVVSASSNNMIKRVIKICGEIDKILDKYNITTAVMEEVQPTGFNTNMNVIKALFTMQAGVRLIIEGSHPKVKTEFLMASSWRSMLGIHTGRGIKRAELKQKDIQLANELYNLQLKSTEDDEADAILIATAYQKQSSSFFK